MPNDAELTKPDWGVVGGRLLAWYAKSVKGGRERKESRLLGMASAGRTGRVTLTLEPGALDVLGDDLGVALADMVRQAIEESEAAKVGP